jgi:hypothetical protein
MLIFHHIFRNGFESTKRQKDSTHLAVSCDIFSNILIVNSKISKSEFNRSKNSCEAESLVSSFMRTVPEEILELILVFSVRGHRDMRTLALTCKRWCAFSQQDISWKRLSIRGWGNRADIVQIPIEKHPGQSWYTYYRQRILSHLPEMCYLRSQQHMTVSIR